MRPKQRKLVIQGRRFGKSTQFAKQNAIDAARYYKLRHWMSSNVEEGWREVEQLASIACYVDWKAFDQSLDSLPICNVGLCYKRPKS